MADEYSISYSLPAHGNAAAQASDSAATTSGGGDLYAFAECEVVDMQNGAVLLLDQHSDAQVLISPQVAIALKSCRTFRTIEQHVALLTSTIPQLAGQQADVTNVLHMIRDAGLMVSASDVCRRLGTDIQPALDLPPTRVCVITCDRPAAVERLLQSMLHAGNLTRHEQLFLVDDSRDQANAERNRAAVENFNLTSPRDMQYVGQEAQAELLRELVAALPAQENAIRFLIDRSRWASYKTYGLARNLCLLLSLGCRAIVIDDDVICAAVEAPVKGKGLQFDSTPREAEFYSSQEDILARTRRAEFDPLAGHAQCLGLTMGQAVSKLCAGDLQPAQLAGANSAFLSQWHANSPVLVTQSGSIGDPGTDDSEWLYTLPPASSERLQNSPGGLQAALANRHYWLGQPRPTFTKMAHMSQMTGLDNSALLPPYFPVFRNEDYLFGAMVEYLHPQAAVLEYGWCVPHFPLEERSGQASEETASARPRFNPGKLVTDRTDYSSGISAGSRLQNLASLVRNLSETGDQGLKNMLRRETAELQATDLALLRTQLQDGSKRPAAATDWLQRSLNALNQAMQTPTDVTAIRSLPAGISEQAVLDTFRDFAGGFSAALQAWEQIREEAAKIAGDMLASGRFTP